MKKAFTLAEVLLTLGIIGVVAAMTMPVVINTTKNIVTLNRLKKIYSVMAQAIERTVGTDDWNVIPLADSSDESIENWYKEMFEKNIKITRHCVNAAGCWNDGTLMYNGARHSSDRGSIGIGGNCLTFTTLDGYFVLLDAWAGNDITNQFGVETTHDGLTIYVDVNANKGPNTIGKDVFVFVYSMENGLTAAGHDLAYQNISAECTNTGILCAEKIIRDGWQIKYN